MQLWRGEGLHCDADKSGKGETGHQIDEWELGNELSSVEDAGCPRELIPDELKVGDQSVDSGI
jgi:hypothetical protein